MRGNIGLENSMTLKNPKESSTHFTNPDELAHYPTSLSEELPSAWWTWTGGCPGHLISPMSLMNDARLALELYYY